MTTNDTTFPSVDIPHPLKLAGVFPVHQEYQAKMFVPEGLVEMLQAILFDSRLPEYGKNPSILADWSFCRLDPQTKQVTHVSRICFFRDGSDSPEDEDSLGVLFCRRDQEFLPGEHSVGWRVHIPEDPQQRVLLAVSDYTSEYCTEGKTAKLDALQGYLLSIVNDQSAWGEIGRDFREEEEEAMDLLATLALFEARFQRLE